MGRLKPKNPETFREEGQDRELYWRVQERRSYQD
jgi:hypothetical protein